MLLGWYRRCSVSMETFDGLQAPGLTFRPVGLCPGHRLPVGRKNKARTGVGDFHTIAGRLPYIEEKGSLNGVFVGACLDLNAGFEKDVGGAQDILALVNSIGDVVEAYAAA